MATKLCVWLLGVLIGLAAAGLSFLVFTAGAVGGFLGGLAGSGRSSASPPLLSLVACMLGGSFVALQSVVLAAINGRTAKRILVIADGILIVAMLSVGYGRVYLMLSFLTLVHLLVVAFYDADGVQQVRSSAVGFQSGGSWSAVPGTNPWKGEEQQQTPVEQPKFVRVVRAVERCPHSAESDQIS